MSSCSPGKWLVFGFLGLALLPVVTAFAQSTTGSISGMVTDRSGAPIANAAVLLTNPANGISRTVMTGGAGFFAAPQLPPGSYTISVEMPGFSRVVRNGVVLTAGGQLNGGRFVLEAGAATETVTQTAEAAQIDLQSTSAERSGLLTNAEIRDLSLNGRNMLDLLVILPGVLSRVNGEVSTPTGLNLVNINGTRGNQYELTIDGSSNVDTASNGVLHVTINPDAVAEVRVLAANYQAEYGRSAGGYIQFVTKSGARDFHGTGRFFHRHEGLNANNYFRNAEGRNANGSEVQPRPLYRYNYMGYDIGGPVRFGRWNEGKNKLFFYWNQEFYRQLVASPARNILVPTAAERRGDFSQTVDGDGNRIFIRDPNRTGNCNAADQTSCFPGNIIPPERFFRDGPAILNLYPIPNFAGENRFNYTSSLSAAFPRREDIVRVDYNASERTRLMMRYINNSDSLLSAYGAGNFLLSPIESKGSGRNGVISVSHVFSPALTGEFIFGPSSGRITRAAGDEKATRGAAKITFPSLFPSVDDSSYIPNFTYSGIANINIYPVANFSGLPSRNVNHTFNFTGNLSKVWGPHTIKTGVFVQRNRKDRTATTPVGANIAFTPGPPQHPFASALLGTYFSYQQASNSPQGLFRHTTLAAYVQDNWKVTPRLTLDYGLRLSWFQPQYDARLQTGVFNPDLYDAARAVRLYEPICLTAAACPTGSASLRAVDPANRPAVPTMANTLPSDLVALIVPGSGDIANGIGRTSQGYARGGFDDRGVQWGPRFGFAYDVSSSGRTVVRGGLGISSDRIAGDDVFPMILNPPTIVSPLFLNGRLQDLTTGSVNLAPPDVFGAARDGKIPTVYSASLGVQRDAGFNTIVDIAYVATLSRHLPQLRNLNAIPLGTLFTREAQDPTRFTAGVVPAAEPNLPEAHRQAGFNFSGSFARRQEFLRPFPDYANIQYREFSGSANYHSLQIAANRRFSRGLQFSASYTWSKALGTASTDLELSTAYDTNHHDYRLLAFDRQHIFGLGFVYDVPNLSRHFGGHRLTGAIVDNWQVSGITSLVSGAPLELVVNVAPGGISRITGSSNQGTGFYLKRPPQPAPNGFQIDPDAIIVPPIGDKGPWPRQYLRGPGMNNHNLSIFKNFPIAGEDGRYLQLRFEMFNVPNHTQFNSINTATNLAVPSATGGFTTGIGPALNDYSRAVITSNLRPAGSTEPLGRFFGEFNGAASPRVIQLGVKLYF